VLKHTSYAAADRELCADVSTSALLLIVLFTVPLLVIGSMIATPLGEFFDSPDVGTGFLWMLPRLLFFAFNKVLINVPNGLQLMKIYALFRTRRFVLIPLNLIAILILGLDNAMLPFARLLPLRVVQNWRARIREPLSFGLRGMLSGGLTALNARVDVIVLSYFTPATNVGLYNFAAMLAEGFAQFPITLRWNPNPFIKRDFGAKRRAEITALGRPRRGHVFLLIGLLIVTVLVSLPQLPSIKAQGRDSGVFAYTAEMMLQGKVPYRDTWDHKPPLIYVINALAFAFFGANRWTLWLVEVLFFYGTSLLVWGLLRVVYHRPGLAVFGTLIFMFQAHHPRLVGTANYTESYALLWQALCLLIGYSFLQQPNNRMAFGIGLVSGLAFLTKQNIVSVALTFIPAVLVTRHPILRAGRQRWTWLGAMVLGGLIPLAVTALLFLAFGALAEAFDAIMIASTVLHSWYNDGSAPLWITIGNTLKSRAIQVTMLPLSPFAAAGLVIAIRNTRERFRPLSSKRGEQSPDQTTFHLWVAFTFLLDMTLANLSNRAYDHYYITPMLAFVLLIVLALSRPLCIGRTPAMRNRMSFAIRVYLLMLLLWWLPLAVLSAINTGPFGPVIEHDLTAYIAEHTNPDDTILVWGANSQIYFQAHRRSASRVHYAYPLVAPDYASDADIEAFVSDLETNRPVLIVDTTREKVAKKIVPPLDPERREAWWAEGGPRDTQDLEPVYRFWAAHCTEIAFELEQMVIYHCRYESALD
jgi:hypothetical protein